MEYTYIFFYGALFEDIPSLLLSQLKFYVFKVLWKSSILSVDICIYGRHPYAVNVNSAICCDQVCSVRSLYGKMDDASPVPPTVQKWSQNIYELSSDWPPGGESTLSGFAWQQPCRPSSYTCYTSTVWLKMDCSEVCDMHNVHPVSYVKSENIMLFCSIKNSPLIWLLVRPELVCEQLALFYV